MTGEVDELNPDGGALDYEAELCIVIGKKCRNASVETALSYVLGYANSNDVPSRPLLPLAQALSVRLPTCLDP